VIVDCCCYDSLPTFCFWKCVVGTGEIRSAVLRVYGSCRRRSVNFSRNNNFENDAMPSQFHFDFESCLVFRCLAAHVFLKCYYFLLFSQLFSKEKRRANVSNTWRNITTCQNGIIQTGMMRYISGKHSLSRSRSPV
jgi:hypothetical protein